MESAFYHPKHCKITWPRTDTKHRFPNSQSKWGYPKTDCSKTRLPTPGLEPGIFGLGDRRVNPFRHAGGSIGIGGKMYNRPVNFHIWKVFQNAFSLMSTCSGMHCECNGASGFVIGVDNVVILAYKGVWLQFWMSVFNLVKQFLLTVSPILCIVDNRVPFLYT